jgi:hypothetical protein
MRASSKGQPQLPRLSGDDRRAGVRFCLDLTVRYAIEGNLGARSGRTIDPSSSGISFVSDRPLQIGQVLKLSIDWPVPLDGGVRLQLVMMGDIVRTDGTLTALQIRRHEFKTRGVGLNASASESIDE